MLTQFNGVEWSTGDRKIISDQTANGLVPLEDGLSRSVPLDSYNYQVTATNDFQSTWLPTQFPVSDITAHRRLALRHARRWTSSPATTRPPRPA